MKEWFYYLIYGSRNSYFLYYHIPYIYYILVYHTQSKKLLYLSRHPELTIEEIVAIKDMFSYAEDQGWLNNSKNDIINTNNKNS